MNSSNQFIPLSFWFTSPKVAYICDPNDDGTWSEFFCNNSNTLNLNELSDEDENIDYLCSQLMQSSIHIPTISQTNETIITTSDGQYIPI